MNRASALKAMAADLRKSNLTPADAKKRSLKLLSTKQTQETTKTDNYAGSFVWSYLIPYFDIKGKRVKDYWRVRYLEELLGKFGPLEKSRRYTGPKGAKIRTYFDPTLDWAKELKDDDLLTMIVEGEKKAQCAVNDGVVAIGIGGVDCWRQGGELLPDLAAISWKGRDVVLFFDSDYKSNPDVQRALIKLDRELRKRGATVRRAEPPNGPNGEKWGYDDCRVNLGKRATLKLVDDAEEIELPPDKIEELNERYYVAPEGSNVRIFDEIDGTAYTQQDFRLLYANQYVEDADGKIKPLGSEWIKHPQRRQYTQTIFDPDAPDDPTAYNRYKGFAYEPSPGDWSLLREHIRQVICSGNDEHTEYLLDWLARGVQHPGKRAEIAIVLRGEQGTGKGVFVNAYATLFAPHAYHASSSIEITGRFSGHIKDVLFIFMDEAFFAGDKTHVGTLKKIITEQTIAIEEKFKQRIEVRNRLKIIIASNEHWVIPAGNLERRFFVLDVLRSKQQQTEYFGALIKQLKNGGYEAFLHDLLMRDISEFNFRSCPRTDALAEQQLYSMTPVEVYWVNLVDEGELPREQGWGQIEKHILYDHFSEATRRRGLTHLPDIGQFYQQLKQLLPAGYPKTTRPRVHGSRPYIWHFPSLNECRKRLVVVRGGPT